MASGQVCGKDGRAWRCVAAVVVERTLDPHGASGWGGRGRSTRMTSRGMGEQVSGWAGSGW